ncbi:hypothetical protein QFZ49_003575 [Streptomyces turgidiscabies]|uniref:Uncharacterized protein n=1 Tax=Streptomyces turgidiscabies TaxID=85558 RepID=A0ABU0RNT2_9ACTN|nr:hypothetical protein [Streptomyces turgidiscabies]
MTRMAECIPTGRLVIPAEAGSGKTVLVERFLVGDASRKIRTCGMAARTAPQRRGRRPRGGRHGWSQGLTLLHRGRDRDFECVTAVTGQALQWYGPVAGK